MHFRVYQYQKSQEKMTGDGNDGFSLKQEATVPKLSQSIVLGAEFQSYHDFNAVLDTYCQQNAISNTPLAFVKRNQKRLLTNTFGDDLLDQQTIDRFVYQSLSLICVHHRSNSSNKDGLFCEGRITIRYIRSKNVLQISSFITKHSNHKTEHITQHPNHHASVHSSYNDSSSSLRTAQLNRIFGLIHRMQDNGALDLVENVCQTILEKWDGENDGLEIHLVEKVINDPHQNDLPAVSGSGKLLC